jgi:hypothetical protein
MSSGHGHLLLPAAGQPAVPQQEMPAANLIPKTTFRSMKREEVARGEMRTSVLLSFSSLSLLSLLSLFSLFSLSSLSLLSLLSLFSLSSPLFSSLLSKWRRGLWLELVGSVRCGLRLL